MIARRAPLLLIFGLFTLVGCRDALVDEQPVAEDSPTETAPSENTMYMKGPATLRVGEARYYRAEPIREAARYAWSQESFDEGRILGVPADTTNRFFELTGVQAGSVRVTVEAFDLNNQMIRVATRTILVE